MQKDQREYMIQSFSIVSVAKSAAFRSAAAGTAILVAGTAILVTVATLSKNHVRV